MDKELVKDEVYWDARADEVARGEYQIDPNGERLLGEAAAEATKALFMDVSRQDAHGTSSISTASGWHKASARKPKPRSF